MKSVNSAQAIPVHGSGTESQLQLPKTECPRHGNCMECVEFHKNNSDKIPFCLRSMIKIQGI